MAKSEGSTKVVGGIKASHMMKKAVGKMKGSAKGKGKEKVK